jgi:hypothetical protein
LRWKAREEEKGGEKESKKEGEKMFSPTSSLPGRMDFIPHPLTKSHSGIEAIPMPAVFLLLPLVLHFRFLMKSSKGNKNNFIIRTKFYFFNGTICKN